MSFYSLLHLEEKEHSAVNVKTADFDDQVRLYVSCAVCLSNSLALEGRELTVITNNGEAINRAAAAIGGRLKIREIPFVTEIPSGIDFYSAHHKIDCYRYFAGLDAPYAALVDLDAICVNAFPASFDRNIELGVPMCYDISDQAIPTHGAERLRQDLKKIHGHESEGRWYGGEFICAPPLFYRRLVEKIEGVYDNYTRHISDLHHVGDETLTTAAIELLKLDGIQVADAGTLGIVARHWNCSRPGFIQRPFEHASNAAILHLPIDKPFLAKLGRSKQASHRDFFRRYDFRRKDYLLRKLRATGGAVRLGLKHFRTYVSNPLLHKTGIKKRHVRR
ncbi:hypothetical protein [Hoeflea sp. TYP-13]|uniref:hypothetical protein n=1 Tax=Hoeflea sp. TYP-13 TaxID=3230023 RepID=UPI0034C6A34D